MAYEIIELEKAYALAQDLDVVKYSSTSKSYTQTTKPTSSQYPNRFQGQTSIHKEDTKGKSVENKGKVIDKEFQTDSVTLSSLCTYVNTGIW